MAAPRTSLSRSPSATPTPSTPTTTRRTNQNPFAALESSSEDDDAILRPRGKMASRMQVRGDEPQESASEVDDDDDDEEVVTTTRPRKLKSRREGERSSTPPQTRDAQDVASSPGLFVSPAKPQQSAAGQDEDDLLSPPALAKNHRYQAMLEKKRQERLAREAEAARKQAERLEAAGYNDEDEEEDDNITDDDAGRKLTQEAAAARPPRKASKKAQEDIHRETQRLTRSLQLAHEAKVRKKITKATLFERFNFKPEGFAAPAEKLVAPASSSRPPTPGSAQQSDAEMGNVETPPSSPPAAGKEQATILPPAAEAPNLADDEDDFPTLEETIQRRLDKGKGKATSADPEPQLPAAPPKAKRNVRVILPPLHANPTILPVSLASDDDDDDLQILPPSKSASAVDAMFARIPLNQAKESRPLQHLRRLAHLDDPDKRPTLPSRAGSKPSRAQAEHAMTASALKASLWQRAREQAKAERDRHLEVLRAKGVHVQTAEEKEKEMRAVEDIVARERRKAEEIMDREREEGKVERRRKREAGEEDPLGWDDDESDDEEYREEGEEEVVELSGSEEEDEEGEEEEDGEEDEEEEEEDVGGVLIDDAAVESAGESEMEGAEEKVGGEDSDEELPSSKNVRRRARKQVAVLSDDEDDEDDVEPLVKATPRPKAHFAQTPSVRNPQSPCVPTSVLRSATKTFIPGLPVAGPAGLGLTQIFAGTMDDSQMGTAAVSPSQPRPTFDPSAFPDSNFSQTEMEATADDMILDSQPTRETQQAETQGVQIRFAQSQMHGFDTFLQGTQTFTQASDLIEPTQDAGFRDFSPLRRRFGGTPASTVDTVPVGQTQGDEQNESPLMRRTGKLRRRADMALASPTRRPAPDGDDEAMEDLEADEFGFGTVPNNAFAAMKEAALKEKKRKEVFDKKKSRARDMVEDQAEESEDEYAGLGGADGEGSDDDDDQSVKEMIDDETKDDEGDERKLAAFYADRERASDEKQVEKLFHDITTGMLRRKRNGNWDDLSDSDDGGEARRRMKRRKFAKAQRALMADERISKVAENPRNQAFLRTIEDAGSDDDMDFIFAPPLPPPGFESQESQAGQAAVIPNSQPLPATVPNPRRTKSGRKPSNMAEIRESVSNLLDEPYHASSSLIPATELGSSDVEDDSADALRPPSSHSGTASDKENRNPRRSKPTNPAVIDRVALKRNASSTSTTSANKLAFASGAGSSSTTSSFKVPALLRRATTNSLLSTSSSSSSTTTTTPSTTRPGESMKIKKPAGKRSGVSYLARETERRQAVADADRRREEKKVRGAEGRVRAVGGLLRGAGFE